MKTQKTRPSVLKGEAKFELDERTKKALVELLKKVRKAKLNQVILAKLSFVDRKNLPKAKKRRLKGNEAFLWT